MYYLSIIYTMSVVIGVAVWIFLGYWLRRIFRAAHKKKDTKK